MENVTSLLPPGKFRKIIVLIIISISLYLPIKQLLRFFIRWFSNPWYTSTKIHYALSELFFNISLYLLPLAVLVSMFLWNKYISSLKPIVWSTGIVFAAILTIITPFLGYLVFFIVPPVLLFVALTHFILFIRLRKLEVSRRKYLLMAYTLIVVVTYVIMVYIFYNSNCC